MTDFSAPRVAGETPQTTFGLSTMLCTVLQELGFKELTPIQKASIPLLLEGHDLIAQSQTGSGKTAAYSLPILDRLELGGRKVQALILCPTRELCAQVAREIRRLGRKQQGLQALCLTGGESTRPQIAALEKGVHIIVGTPGRVLDHLKRETLDLRSIRTLVLDEADRMLDMGFQEEMEKILAAAPQQRQTLFFSATFPATIEDLSQRFQKQAKRIAIAQAPEASARIQQFVHFVSQDQKLTALIKLLQEHRPDQAIIFCNQKAGAKELKVALEKIGASAAALHGDLEQFDRDRVMARFRNQSVRYLVATDVAARGIDVAGLDAVFNFDLPSKPEVYVHRIGRTGRAGKSGLAISLAPSRESNRLRSIEELTGEKCEEIRWDPNFKPKNFATPAMVTLSIGGGRKDKLRPGDILGACTGEAGGLAAHQVGKIEIHDHYSYLAVSQSAAHAALERLRQGRIKARKFSVEFVSH